MAIHPQQPLNTGGNLRDGSAASFLVVRHTLRLATSNNRDRFHRPGFTGNACQVVPIHHSRRQDRIPSSSLEHCWHSRTETVHSSSLLRIIRLAQPSSIASSIAYIANSLQVCIHLRNQGARNVCPSIGLSSIQVMSQWAREIHALCPRLPTTEQSSGRLSGWATAYRCSELINS